MQQTLQALGHRVIALECRRRLAPTGQRGIEQQPHIGLFGEIGERGVQALGRDVEFKAMGARHAEGQGEGGECR
ncbi:hypothetical protein D9M69_681750 [compost metagenome]